MNILVTTITCNRLHVTREWLPSLQENSSMPFKHVVVDNGSDDGTADWLEENGYDTVALPENRGIMGGWITAWEHALADGFRPDVVVKYDDDVEIITPNLLDRLVKFVEGEKRVAAPYNVTLNRVPAPMGKAQNLDGEKVVPTRMLGGMLIAVPADCFSEMVEAGGIKKDVSRGNWWRKNGYQPYYLTDLKAAHHGRGTIDRQGSYKF